MENTNISRDDFLKYLEILLERDRNDMRDENKNPKEVKRYFINECSKSPILDFSPAVATSYVEAILLKQNTLDLYRLTDEINIWYRMSTKQYKYERLYDRLVKDTMILPYTEDMNDWVY